MPPPPPPPLLPPLPIDINSESDDDFTEDLLPLIISAATQSTQNTERIRSLLLPGKTYVNELLASAHVQRCKEVLRMRIETFFTLRDWLLANTSLKSSRKTNGISIEEKLVIFLYITTRGASNRECQERFCYGAGTIMGLVHLIFLYTSSAYF